jgi:hypothetical protein
MNPISSTMKLSIAELETDFPLATVFLPKADIRDRMYMQYIRDVVLAPDPEVRTHKNTMVYSLQAAHTAVSVRCNSQDLVGRNRTELSIEVPNYNGSGTTNLGLLKDLLVGRPNHWDTIFIEPPIDSMYSKVAITDPYLPSHDSLVTCGVRAIWEPAMYEIRGDSDLRTIHSTPALSKKALNAVPISMTDEWTEQLKNSTSESIAGFLDLRPFKELNTSSADSILTTPWEVYLAAIVAQGVSSTWYYYFPYYNCIELEGPGNDFDYQVLNVQIAWENCSRKNTCPVEDFDMTSTSCGNLKTRLMVSGYGYGITTTSVVLSLIVLSSYCALVGIYIILVLFRGTTSTALDTNAELVTLALQSRHPKHLGNTSVGIETMATLRAPVSIRVNSEQSLELVFRDDPGQQGRLWTKVEANKAY